MNWFQRWQKERHCFHHEILLATKSSVEEHPPARSWIHGQLIDMGRRKMFICTHCERTWII